MVYRRVRWFIEARGKNEGPQFLLQCQDTSRAFVSSDAVSATPQGGGGEAPKPKP